MQTTPISLGDQISEKISGAILALVISVIFIISVLSWSLSHQLFNRQIHIWDTVTPQQTLTNLIDSDYFSITKNVEFLRSTGLFSSVYIADNKKKIIASFGHDHFSNKKLVPITDSAKVTWGYYYFVPDFYRYISLFVDALVVFFAFIIVAFFIIRRRTRNTLEAEFVRFNNFLANIEKITQQLPEVYKNNGEFKIENEKNYNSEQVIINQTISRLINEIIQAHHSLRKAVALAEQKRFEKELSETAMQVAHDLRSPLLSLEVMSINGLPEPGLPHYRLGRYE